MSIQNDVTNDNENTALQCLTSGGTSGTCRADPISTSAMAWISYIALKCGDEKTVCINYSSQVISTSDIAKPDLMFPGGRSVTEQCSDQLSGVRMTGELQSAVVPQID